MLKKSMIYILPFLPYCSKCTTIFLGLSEIFISIKGDNHILYFVDCDEILLSPFNLDYKTYMQLKVQNTRFTRKPTCKIPNPLYPDLDHCAHLILWDWHRYSDFKTETPNEKRKVFKITPELFTRVRIRHYTGCRYHKIP